MRIVGIDPGTLRCGYGVVDTDGGEPRVVAFGVISGGRKALAERLRIIYEGLCGVMEDFGPDVVAVEGAFYGKNARTALKIGEGRGVALVAAAGAGAELVEYAPAQVKKSVVGNGQAHKQQVQEMVRTLLNLPQDEVKEDAADALAIAICHCHRLGPV